VSTIVGIDEPGVVREYGPEVFSRVEQGDAESYVSAAKELNESGVDVVVIQHEFGLHGIWESGIYRNDLEGFFANIQIPVVTTLHTVMPEPSASMRDAIRFIANSSQKVVVMAETAVSLLRTVYKVERDILVVPHGMPAIAPRGRREFKRKLNLEGRTTLSTFGLVDPRKGMEYVVEALPAIVERFPDVFYLIIRQTHPVLAKNEGELYRDKLIALADKLGVTDNIRFINSYLTQEEIVAYLIASDVYVVPYLDPNQITSGTLAYALGAGKAIVSTKFLHAREALANGRGVLVDFRSSQQLGDAIGAIVGDPLLKQRLEHRAYDYGKEFAWPRVADRVISELSELVVFDAADEKKRTSTLIG